MPSIEPQSPFLKFVPENEQTYFTKKISSFFQTDKENVIGINPKIQVNKILIGQNEIDAYLVEVGDLIKLSKENVRELIQGLQKENKPKRVIIGILGHKPLKGQKAKSILGHKSIGEPKGSFDRHLEELMMNLNILVKLRHEQSPWVSMFACNCLMQILKLYIRKRTEFKEEDLTLKWKHGFYLENNKIGEVLVFHEVKKQNIFANIAIRMKLSGVTSDQREFVGDLLQEFGCRLNISKNLSEAAFEIHSAYQSSLMFLGQEVIIKRRQPNQWQDTVSGKFTRVNEVGNAILEGEQGNQEEVQDGYIELRKNNDYLSGQNDSEEKEHLEGIAI